MILLFSLLITMYHFWFIIMRFKAILFDLDGTLVDSVRLFPQLIVQEFLNTPSPDQVRKYITRLGTFYNAGGKYTWFRLELFRAIHADFRLSWGGFVRGMTRVLWQFYKWDQKSHVFPEVPKTLKLLKENGYMLGIVSNGSPYLLKKRFGPFLDFFDVLADSKSLGVRKPSPEPLQYACRQLDISINEAIFVGDTIVDLLAAKNAKMQIILVKTGTFGLPPIQKVNYNPFAVISAVGKELISLLS